MEKTIKSVVAEQYDGKRISEYLRRGMGLSLTLVKRVKWGGVSLRGEVVHMRATVHTGDTVEVRLPVAKSENITPREMPISVVYEDEYFIAVDKPAGMPTHPSRGNHLPTLAEGLCAYFAPEPFVFRSVNRLDRDTSGIVLVAKDQHTASLLAKEMKAGGFLKKYLALLSSTPTLQSGIIDAPIAREAEGNVKRVVREDGKRAVSEYRVAKILPDGRCIADITLHTGRTHQIRVHMAHIGSPLYGDFLYGERVEGESYLLHAYSLNLTHPYSGEELRLLTSGYDEIMGNGEFGKP